MRMDNIEDNYIVIVLSDLYHGRSFFSPYLNHGRGHGSAALTRGELEAGGQGDRGGEAGAGAWAQGATWGWISEDMRYMRHET